MGILGKVLHRETATTIVTDEVGNDLKGVDVIHAPEFVEDILGIVGIALEIGNVLRRTVYLRDVDIILVYVPTKQLGLDVHLVI